MFSEDLAAAAASAEKKIALLRTSKMQYLIFAMLAGMFVGFGVCAMSTAGGALSAVSHPLIKLLNAALFPAALSFVVFAGAELFTGNVFLTAVGVMEKRIRLSELFSIWLFSYLGNLLGSMLCAALFAATGLLCGDTLRFVLSSMEAKTTLSFGALFFRGLFCNLLVCLAVWCCTKTKSESGKLCMIFWCIFVFVLCGFEHSIANMTMFSLGLFAPREAASAVMAGLASGNAVDLSLPAGLFRSLYNLFFVTAGNITGGLLLAWAYHFISMKRDR